MHDHYELSNLVKTLRHLKGYMVVSVEDEELVILRKKEFDELKGEKKEIQLELEKTAIQTEIPEYELEEANHELDMQQVNFNADDAEIGLDEREQLGAGPRKKVRFEPLRGDLSPELQE